MGQYCSNHLKNENKVNEDDETNNTVSSSDPDNKTPEFVTPENILNNSETGVAALSETFDPHSNFRLGTTLTSRDTC